MAAIVIDANLAIALIVPLPYSELASTRMRDWIAAGVQMLAPALWAYEVASGLRKAVVLKAIPAAQASAGLQALDRLSIELVAPTLDLHHNALAWAARLGQKVAYDAAYVALAEQRRAELWMADRSLAQKARAAGATWVRYLIE